MKMNIQGIKVDLAEIMQKLIINLMNLSFDLFQTHLLFK